jgi:hypothetical protein
MMTIEEGSVLYNVYGMDAPEELGGTNYFIGDLMTTSEVTPSLWGDDGLFFRHQMTEDDIAIKPDWEPYYVKSIYATDDNVLEARNADQVAGKGCPFAHLWQ